MTIKTEEKERDGLKRAFMLTIPAADIEARVAEEVKRIAPQVRMPGFRPGKVPPNLIRKMHGESLHQDALNTAVQSGVQQLMNDKAIRPAVQPQVELKDYAPGKDAEISVTVEALPNLPTPNYDGLKIQRLTVAGDDKAVEDQILGIAKGSKRWKDAPKGHKAENGDLVVINFDGKIKGKAFQGGSGEGMQVELGMGRLIPGFEDQLVGVSAREKRDVEVKFPDDYPSDETRGKAATFAVTVTAVKTGIENVVDDELAKSLGLTDLEQLRGLIRGQQEQELNGLTRTHMKRQLLDQLSERHDFPVPESMVEAEYQNILHQLRHEANHEADPQKALAEIEADAAEYRRIAERRVRLGLLLSEIGALNGIAVSDQEMNQIIAGAAAQYQGKDRDAFIRYVQQDANAQAQLRAPLYEDKVVDFLFSTAEITDREASRAELEADLEAEEGHVHGPGCGHDHAAPAKSAKKGKAKAAEAKASPSKAEGAKAKSEKAKAEAPAKGPVEEKATDRPKPAKPVKDGAGAKPAAKAADKPAKAENAPAKAAAKPAAKSAAKPAKASAKKK